MRKMRKFMTFAFALVAGLLMSSAAEAKAAQVTVDTKYGERTFVEPDYENYYVFGNTQDTVVLFYNGEFTQSQTIVGGETTAQSVVTTGTSKYYSPSEDYQATELEAGANIYSCIQEDTVIAETSFTYGANKPLTYVKNEDGVETTNASPVKEIMLKRDLTTYVLNVLDELSYTDNDVSYYTYFLSSGIFAVRIEKENGDIVYYTLIDDGTGAIENDADVLTAYNALWAAFPSAQDTASYYVLFGNKDITGVQNGSPYVISPVHGDARTVTFDVYAGTTEVTVDVEPTVISISVPLNVGVVINVNEDDAIVQGDLEIDNQTKGPVKVSIQALTSTNLPFENLILPTSLPEGLEWDTLNTENSAKYFSFGLRALDSDNTPWKSKVEDFAWATDSFTKTELGVIDAESISNVEIDARFGRMQTNSSEFSFAVTFVAELE